MEHYSGFRDGFATKCCFLAPLCSPISGLRPRFGAVRGQTLNAVGERLVKVPPLLRVANQQAASLVQRPFETMRRELQDVIGASQPVRRDAGFQKADIAEGNFSILNGQTASVAEIGKPIKAANGEYDARLRVIRSDGAKNVQRRKSNVSLRSLQRALYEDAAGRRISEPTAPTKTTGPAARSMPNQSSKGRPAAMPERLTRRHARLDRRLQSRQAPLRP